MLKILITGCAGFIGSNLVDRLLLEGHEVIGIDNFNDYYDPEIKKKNLQIAQKNKKFKLWQEDILNFAELKKIFNKENPQKVVHLAARAGVRASIANPSLYAQVNVLGTVNLLKLAVEFEVKQFIFGSSSSVYGNSKKLPFFEDDRCENIISPYGASKKSAEFFVEVFSKTTNMKCLILRFFTVYGPRGRPDMAPALFTEAILSGSPIQQFGDGQSSRDYTYVDDVVEGIIKSLDKNFNFEIINLGNNSPVRLVDFIKILEKVVGKKAKIVKANSQPGDVKRTWAKIDKAKKLLAWQPKTSLEEGLTNYIKWLKQTQ